MKALKEFLVEGYLYLNQKNKKFAADMTFQSDTFRFDIDPENHGISVYVKRNGKHIGTFSDIDELLHKGLYKYL